MNNSTRQFIKIGNICFFCYLVYCLIILGTEWLYFIVSLLDIEIPVGIFEFCGIVIVTIFLYFYKDVFEFCKLKIDLPLVIGCIFILLFGFLMSVYPDNAFDTYNYHLVAQSPRFTNYFTEHFAKGYFQVWGFRFGDRLFYYFRLLLGYRLGTTLNVIVLVISYIQIYEMLANIETKFSCASESAVHILCNKMLWAGMLVLLHDALLMIGVYYVDILAVPIGLEVMRILLLDREENPSLKDVGYFALLNGIWIALKLTNVCYVIPCVLIYILSHRKSFTIKTWGTAVGLGIFPFGLYLIHNFICTGNPIFPYYNKLFHSNYYREANFKDGRWGGVTLFEKLTWIVYSVFKPEYRQSEIYSRFNFMILLGIIAAVVFLIQILWKWVNKRHTDNRLSGLISITIVSTLLWSLTTGYSRYFIFGKLLWGILAYILCLNLVSFSKIISYLAASVCMGIIIAQTSLTGAYYVSGSNWVGAWKLDNFTEHLRKVGTDKAFLSENPFDIDMFYLSNTHYTGIAHLIDDDIYTFVPGYASELDDVTVMREARASHANEYAGEKVDIWQRDLSQITDYVDRVNERGMYIEDFKDVYHADMGNFLLATVDDLGERANVVYISDEKIEVPFVSEANECTLKFICGRIYDREEASRYNMAVYIVSGDNKNEIFATEVDNVEVISYSVPITTDCQEFEIVFEFCNSKGELIDCDETDKIFVMNPMVTGNITPNAYSFYN